MDYPGKTEICRDFSWYPVPVNSRDCIGLGFCTLNSPHRDVIFYFNLSESNIIFFIRYVSF